MKPRYRTRVVNLIKKSKKKSLSVAEIHNNLIMTYPNLTKNQIKKILLEVVRIDREKIAKGESPQYFILPNKGGKSFRYTAGGETTSKGTGPYRDITKVIDSDSKSITNIFGALHLNSFDVHAGKSERGEWGRPDVIVALYKKVGSSRHFNLHAIEYEAKGGFSPANVAQAYFGGSGADKRWLLFDSRDWPKNASERKKNPSAERIRKFAQKLGVGLIYYRNLSRSGDWFMLEPARQQIRNKEERKTLRHLFEGEVEKNQVASKGLNKRRKGKLAS